VSDGAGSTLIRCRGNFLEANVRRISASGTRSQIAFTVLKISAASELHHKQPNTVFQPIHQVASNRPHKNSTGASHAFPTASRPSLTTAQRTANSRQKHHCCCNVWCSGGGGAAPRGRAGDHAGGCLGRDQVCDGMDRWSVVWMHGGVDSSLYWAAGLAMFPCLAFAVVAPPPPLRLLRCCCTHHAFTLLSSPPHPARSLRRRA